MPRRSVTMKDVAAAAGVAQSTVSRILNRAPGRVTITVETRERVEATARELGYRPHPGARALRGASTMLLGAIVRDITDPFNAGVIETLTIAAKERGYGVVLGSAGAKSDEALATVLEARQCDAIVLLGDLRGEPRMIADLRRAEVPVVALWYGSHHPFPTVSVDNRAGVREALTHLSSLGHRRIAFVGGGSHGDIRQRLAAYKEYLASAEIAPTRGYVRQGPNTITDGGLALSALLALPRPPTAILAATDVVAMGLIHAAYEQAVAVPEQLSIVGFDDIPLAAATAPGLTTVKMPTAEMIAWAVELAVGAAGSPFHAAGDPPRIVFQPKLIVRRSTAEAPPTPHAKTPSPAPRTRSSSRPIRAAVTRPRG